MYSYRCSLDRVIDGDTIVLEIDLGFSIFHKIPIRLAYINTPERFTEEGRAATAYTANWLEEHRDSLVLCTLKDRQGKYGRYLGIIFSGREHLNGALVDEGHAVYYK